MKFFLTAIFMFTIVEASGDGPVLMKPTEASFVFEGGIRVSLKKSLRGYLETVNIDFGEKALKFTKKDFGEVPDPFLNTVNLTEPSKGQWSLTLSYAYGQKVSNAFSELTIDFNAEGYLGRELKIPTGKNRWKYRSQKAGMEEIDAGSGGVGGIVTPSDK